MRNISEENELKKFSIVIGVLSFLLLFVLIVSFMTLTIMKKRMNKKWRAEMVSKEVERGTCLT